ncbi:MAG: hypothetical protein AB1714_21375 [Acidobacteriota bacterium]
MTKRRLVLIAVFAVPLFLSLFVRAPAGYLGSEIAGELERISDTRPNLVCIGNSLVEAAVDAHALEKLTGARSLVIQRGGASSACWYLIMKNVVCASPHRPRYAAVFFVDSAVTLPTFRVEGRDRTNRIDPFSLAEEPILHKLAYPDEKWRLAFYLEQIWPLFRYRDHFKARLLDMLQDAPLYTLGIPAIEDRTAEKAFTMVFPDKLMDPALLTRLQLVEEDEETLPPRPYDFEYWTGRSFLPQYIGLARQNRIQLILVRMKRRRDALEVPSPPGLEQYRRDLQAYLALERIPFLDFTGDPRIKLKHFSAGDHLQNEDLFTRILAASLKRFLK